MNDRNKSQYEEVNVKPIIHDPVEAKNYKNGAYLQPFKHQRSGSDVEDTIRTEGDRLGLQP